MGRSDAIGMFWEDIPQERGRNQIARVMPPIPETGWVMPNEFPNLAAAKCLSIDTETFDPELLEQGPGWARGKGHMVGLSVGTDDGRRWYFPMRHQIEPENNLNPENVLAWARDTFALERQPKIGANLLYDYGWLLWEGVPIKGELVDVQFAEALLDERATTNLDDLAGRYLGEHKETSLLYRWCADYYGGEPNSGQRKNIYRTPARLTGPYAESDADLPMRIIRHQYSELMAQGLLDIFKMECASIPLLVAMRMRGVRVDLDKAEKLKGTLRERQTGLETRLKDTVGFEVNTNAADSLAKAFDKIGISYGRTKPTKRNPDGRPSFTKAYLENLEHPIGDLIREIRLCDKLRSTFIESYILGSNINGRVHCQFHPMRGEKHGTRSGRYSSSNPNLQNIPSRDEELAPLIRGLFLPDEGHRLWRRFDYSQIEYRWLVHYAVGRGAEEARGRYRSDPKTDYHEFTLDMVAAMTGWDVSTKEARKFRRRPIKNINFGLVFGMGEPKLARSLGLDKTEAKELFKGYHGALPFISETMKATSDEAETSGFITTILGRRSRFDLYEPANISYGEDRLPGLPFELAIAQYGSVKRAYLHKALNRKLQGSAADLLKTATLACWKSGVFSVTGVPLLTVHDELDFSDPGTKESAEGFRYIQHVMENSIAASIPIRVEVESGPDWGHSEAL